MLLHNFLLLGFALVCVQADQDVQLEIPQGILKGLKTETVYQNKPYYSFKGIPYAKPNVGPNKFRMPEAADPWEGVYDATNHRSPCPFYCMIKKGLIGEEDCLYLNVYTPVLDKEARKAVMVWFHPGEFNGGTADDLLFGPDYLVENDVLIVTVNSRLGALGFLNTGDKNAFGNAGLKDQVMALKWVKDNIHFFGGCPNRVTIFGASSGSASVQYHMLSPMSEGLFSGVISQSGSVLSSWSINYNARELAFMLGEALGIHTTDSTELVEKISEFHVKDIIAASNELMKTQNHLDGHEYAFGPSIEADNGQDIFLPTDPWTLVKSGTVADVPLMIGVTAAEGLFFAQFKLDEIGVLNTEPEKFLPGGLNITDSNALRVAGERLKKFYFGDKQVSKEDINEYIALLGDNVVSAGVLLFTDIIKSRMTAPIYDYLISYESPLGFIKTLLGITDARVAHTDELRYLFYSHFLKNLPEPGSSGEKMTRIFTKLWTNFAKDRNPTSKLDDDITVNWEPLSNDNSYMNINPELKLEKNLMKDDLDFWKDMYKDIMA